MINSIEIGYIKPYRRIFRICPKMYRSMLKKVPKDLVGSIADPPKRKKCLDEDEVKALLKGCVTIDEKIDGGVLGLAWKGVPVAVGKHHMINYDISSKKKFYGLREWIYENYERICDIPLGWVVYGEWMRSRHNIPYNDLQDYFVAFDVFDGDRKTFLNLEGRHAFLSKIGFAEAHIIHRGIDLDVGDIISITEGARGFSNKSRFNHDEVIEGVIIRNDNGLIGKYVRREFSDSIEENWLTLPLVENKLASWKSRKEK